MITLFLIGLAVMMNTVYILIFVFNAIKTMFKIPQLKHDLALESNMVIGIAYFNNLSFVLLVINDLLYATKMIEIFSEKFRQLLSIMIGTSNIYGIGQFLVLTRFAWILVTIHKLQTDSMAFITVFIGVAVPTAMTILSLSNEYPNIPSEFTSFWPSAYSSFMIYLGLEDLAEFEPHKSISIASIQMATAFASLIIVNLMIAVFSNSTSYIMEHIAILGTIEKLYLLACS